MSSNAGHWRLLVTIIVLTRAVPVGAVGLDKMYWSDRGANTIKRANLDGSQVETLISGLGEARGVAVDYAHHQLYWVDNGTNKIQRSLLDGSHVEDLVNGLQFPAGIVLDVGRNQMFWADTNSNTIGRANLDGTNLQTILSGLGDPYFLALDAAAAQLYWTDYGSDKIQRSNLDGTQVVDLVTNGLGLPRGIDLDLQHGKIYWADRDTDQLQKSNLDGSAIETWHQATPSSAAPHGVALDVDRNHVYWVDNGLVTIKRADLDGSNVVELLNRSSGELQLPWQIVLDLRQITPGCGAADNCTEMVAEERALNEIQAVTQAIAAGTNSAELDYTRDGQVTAADRDYLLHFVLNTKRGDANLDGYFASDGLCQIGRASYWGK